MVARTTDEFVGAEVLPNLDRLENKDWELSRHLIRRCGELGLLGVDAPEEYGGLALDKASSVVVAEHISRSASFAVTFGGQTNLSILPITMFGTEDQQRRYLPRLVTGDIVGAYALSESSSGSDALAARTRATRQPDGSWILSGEKMWISNGGFADLFIVFANVDGDKFTAFLVERSFPGFSSGSEEHKMGLHGSSTTPIVLQDVPVPANNVLGEIGRGHKVALNTLNFGRFKLGAMCVGGCRMTIAESARYASQRKQFNQSIASFGAIKHKLGEMVARTYALESLVYRLAGVADGALADAVGAEKGIAVARVFEELAVESAIAKVFGSEVLSYVVDETVQIHGGNGFVSDYPAERHYRDARVNRIFEGTNEINRLLIPGMLVRRALKGDLGLIPAAQRLQDEVLSPSMSSLVDDDERAGAGTAGDWRLQEGRAHGPGDRDADLRRQADGAAGGPQLLRGHSHRHLRHRERRRPGAPGASGRTPCRAAARSGRTRLCRRSGDADRRGGQKRSCGNGRWRHAADTARRPAPSAESSARQRRRPAPSTRGGSDGRGGLYL